MSRFAGAPLLLALAFSSAAIAASSGSVTHLSGTLSVTKPDGSVRILSQKSRIESGDTLSTERDSYAQVEFADGARLTLKPNTSVTIERFAYAEEKPQEDAFFYTLLKGGMRAVAGVVAERSAERYQVRTAGGTVGLRSAVADCGAGRGDCPIEKSAVQVGRADALRRSATVAIDDCASNRGGDCARLDAAVFVAVADGEAVVRNPQGQVGLAAGQAGALTANQRPIFLANDPGLQFTPPATFIQSIMSGSVVNLGRSLECVVAR
jgi:hypothetical protein